MSKPDITDSIANFLLQDHVELMRENAALREAAEMALEALEKIGAEGNWVKEEAAEKALRQALRQALAKPTWHCPLKNPDCKENCGNYGCGN